MEIIEQNATVLTIYRSDLFNPEKFIGPGCSIWRGPMNGDGLNGYEEQDARSLALYDIYTDRLVIEVGLECGETGENRRSRLMSASIQIDAKIAENLIMEGGQKTLYWIKDTFNIIWFECLGTVIRTPDGNRNVLFVYYSEAKKAWDWNVQSLTYMRSSISPVLAISYFGF